MKTGTYSKMASAILNDVYTGLRGIHTNIALSVEQLEDEIVLARLSLIKQHALQGTLNTDDLMYAINCIPVDCKSLDRCPVCVQQNGDCPEEEIPHFEIPQLVNEINVVNIKYIGSTDRQHPFFVYDSPLQLQNRRYRRRRPKKKPYVYLDRIPNAEGMLDGYIFNAPLMSSISVVGLFKDMRELEEYNCCEDLPDRFTSIDNEVKEYLTNQKIKYYRQLAMPIIPNNQTAR